MKHYCLQSTNSLILFGIRKNCLISGRSLLFYQFTERVIKLTVIIIVRYHCYQLHTKFYQMAFSRWIPYIDENIGDRQCGFQCNSSTTDQIFCLCQILVKKWECNETVHQLFIDFSVSEEGSIVQYSHRVWGIHEVRLIKMCLNEIYSKVNLGKHLFDKTEVK
jgi:hypothetical protein